MLNCHLSSGPHTSIRDLSLSSSMQQKSSFGQLLVQWQSQIRKLTSSKHDQRLKDRQENLKNPVIPVGWLFQDINSFQAISFSPSVDSISVSVLIITTVKCFLPPSVHTHTELDLHRGVVLGCRTSIRRDQFLRFWLNPFWQWPSGRFHLLNPESFHGACDLCSYSWHNQSGFQAAIRFPWFPWFLFGCLGSLCVW